MGFAVAKETLVKLVFSESCRKVSWRQSSLLLKGSCPSGETALNFGVQNDSHVLSSSPS